MTDDVDELAATVSPHLTCEPLTVPVTIELTEELVAAARESYDIRCDIGDTPTFADFLMDVIEVAPTFVFDGVVLDPRTGDGLREVDDDE